MLGLAGAAGERPRERGMEAEAERQRGVARIGHGGGDVERGPLQPELELQRKRERIDRPRRIAVRNPQAGDVPSGFEHLERCLARETVAFEPILPPVQPIRAAVELTDDREQDRRVPGPERRIGVGHVLAPERIGQRPKLGAVRVDPRGQRIRGNGDEVGVGHGGLPRGCAATMSAGRSRCSSHRARRYPLSTPPSLAAAAVTLSAIALRSASA